jgi:lauroyl/myristoyl acyltransferase
MAPPLRRPAPATDFVSQPGLVVPADAAYLAAPYLPLPLMYAYARTEARIKHLLNRSEREAVRQNLAAHFGHQRSAAEIALMTRRFFEYDHVRRLQSAIAPRLGPRRLARLFPMEGVENLDRALEAGRGVLLMASHINSAAMFIAILMLRARGYDVRVAMPTRKDPWAASRLRRAFDRLTGGSSLAELIGAFYCQFNIRPIVQALAENVIVSQTGDGWHSVKFVEVEFLGRKLPFTTGVASIAQLTGAMVVPIFHVGAPPAIRFVIEQPYGVEAAPDREHAIRARVAHYAKLLERHVLENIPCWQHWRVPNTLETLAGWPQRPLMERYRI